ncbi:MAG: amino acid ABC transporter permease [Alphaproteobacteria bacterium]|nr:amino acid ABC transporter permease [Alphaproteobacteria bacterium]
MTTVRRPGAIGWLRQNLFNTVWNSILTVLMLGLLWLTIPPLFDWAVTHATLEGESRTACDGTGACWAMIRARWSSFFYGRYPAPERWRVDLVALLLVVFAVPAMREGGRHQARWALALVGVFPVIAGVLLVGGVFGLRLVVTNDWGGLMVNVILAFVAVAASLPLGIMLALGRRSELPIVRAFSVGFIELWRGVPLLTVLFMGMVMLPLFLPGGMTIDSLLRAMIVLTLFTSAYMAEVVRGGLQGVPRGQAEAAYAMGMGYWQVQGLIVLPQALRLVIPAIVNTVIDLFKDTTLVTIVGLFDLLGVVNQSIKDQAWLGLAREGYAFSATVFFVCCLGMSLYSRQLERRLTRGR